MKAQRIFYHKEATFGGVIEMVIWQLPQPTIERPHGLKYRLVYALEGERVVGYDNETGRVTTNIWASVSCLINL